MVSGVFSIPLDAPKASHAPAYDDELQPTLPLREFISGSENALARVAADAVLRDDRRFNPLVFCGETGTGKSHLCLGLVARWQREHPQRKTLVVAASDFARGFADALDADALADFRRKHRRVDLLLLENLTELAHKQAAQLELIATLDDLLRRDRRVLVTSTRLPNQIAELSPSLVSRLTAGLVVPLTRPAAEPRKTILQRLAKAHRVKLTAAAFEALAAGIDGTVPQLNHAIVMLAARSNGNGRHDAIDIEFVRDYLADGGAASAPTLRGITSRVARYFKLKSADLKGPTRRQAVVRARGAAMYLARTLTGKSLDEVGQYYGGRDHTTVLHAVRKTESLLESDPATRQAIEELTAQLTR